MSKKIVILSLGQFASTDVKKFYSAFENYLDKSGIKGPNGEKITGKSVWDWMVADGHLAALRLGTMQLDDLREKFGKKYGLISIDPTEFESIFNAMCALNSETISVIGHVMQVLSQQESTQLFLISHTNWSHMKYILRQIEPVLPNDKVGIINDNFTNADCPPVLLAMSMFSKCEDHPGSVLFALNKLGFNPDETKVISFLNTVQTIRGFDVTYVPFQNLTNKEEGKKPGVDVFIEALENFTSLNRQAGCMM